MLNIDRLLSLVALFSPVSDVQCSTQFKTSLAIGSILFIRIEQSLRKFHTANNLWRSYEATGELAIGYTESDVRLYLRNTIRYYYI